MRIQTLVASLVCAANLFAQKKHSWQDACFNNPAAPFCAGHDYAVKPQRAGKNSTSKNVVTHPFSPTPRTASPSMIVVGGIDWRFADPFSDALVGLNVSGLAASPLAHSLISQFGAKQGLTDADLTRLFDGLSAVDQIALSVRDNRALVLLTGRVTELALPAPTVFLKAVRVSAGAMLLGPPEAVDQAVQRIAAKGPTGELAGLAEQWQAGSELWVIGVGRLVGPQAVAAGMQRFSLTVSIQDYLDSDWAFEFNSLPDPKIIQTWQTAFGAATLEGNVVHTRLTMEADEVREKFEQIAASPVGQHLASLVAAARYLPARDLTVPKQTKPIIYGLDGGPKVVGQDQNH